MVKTTVAYQNNNRVCNNGNPDSFCYGLAQHTHEKPSTSINYHLTHNENLPMAQKILQRENEFKNIYYQAYRNSRSKYSQAHKYHNSHSLAKPIEIGSQVLLENHQIIPDLSRKFHQLRIGPLIINDKPTEVTYKLIDPRSKNVHFAHRNRIIPYIPLKEYSQDLK